MSTPDNRPISSLRLIRLEMLLLSGLLLGPLLVSSTTPGYAGSTFLSCYESNLDGAKVHNLPKILKEVSGLSVTTQDTLLMHGDESSDIFEYDLSAIKLVAKHHLPGLRIKGDFEGITSKGQTAHLVTSRGLLYAIALDPNLDPTPGATRVTISDLGLSPLCEVEGLSTTPDPGGLALVCKQLINTETGKVVRIYTWAPDTGEAVALDIDNDAFDLFVGETVKVRGSGLVYLAPQDRFLLLSSDDPAIWEITPDGTILGVLRLDPEAHKQPEGLGLFGDGRLVVADEAQGANKARITIYSPQLPCSN